jgi:hypothetical protein
MPELRLSASIRHFAAAASQPLNRDFPDRNFPGHGFRDHGCPDHGCRDRGIRGSSLSHGRQGTPPNRGPRRHPRRTSRFPVRSSAHPILR